MSNPVIRGRCEWFNEGDQGSPGSSSRTEAPYRSAPQRQAPDLPPTAPDDFVALSDSHRAVG
jgi:hypothetical protein